MFTRPHIICVLLLCYTAGTANAERGLKFREGRKERTIMLVDYSAAQILGFDRSGESVSLVPTSLKDPQVIPRFRAYSQSEMRGDLLREFGKKFEVTGTGNYLVVHPKGSRDLWASRFEELYRSMVYFFKQRGYSVSKPKFPLAGIVFHSKAQYQQYCSRVYKFDASKTAGVYMPSSNRIYLYDSTQGKGKKSREWEYNLATVMHEVAHQTAFNVGIHNRMGHAPRWLVEGLGCLFEARGIYDAFHFRNQKDRLNETRIWHLNNKKPSDFEAAMMGLVASDTAFNRDTSQSYSIAWALIFYLSEKQPRDLIRYMKKTNEYGPYDDYSAEVRVRDFRRYFGKDTKMLATRLSRFVDGL